MPSKKKLTETDSKTEVQAELGIETSDLPVKRQLMIVAGILLLVFGTGYIPKVLNSIDQTTQNTKASVPDTTVVKTLPEIPKETDFFEDVSILAESAYVWDVQNQKALYKKSADTQLPLASVTKLMTALVAYELVEGDKDVPITLSAIKQDGSSGFVDGELFSLKKLLDLTLLSSSNDGAYAIASAVGAEIDGSGDSAETFVQAMNIRAEELGLTQTYFRNPTGLDISSSEAGAYGSARDMTFLMEHVLTEYPDILEQTQDHFASITNNDGASHSVENTNPAIDSIPGLIGSKTGYTALAGGNLVVAFDAAFNRPVVVVVLGSTRSGRFEDVLALTDAARKTIQQ